MTDPYFSIVMPVYNESGNLQELHRRLTSVLRGLGRSYELLFIDDGSNDSSFEVLKQLHQEDRNVHVIAFSRNFGHHIALTAGLDEARGEAVVMIDSDLQDQPESIPLLYEKFQQGYDVVYGIPQVKKHSIFKRATSRMFVWLINRLRSGDEPINTHLFRIASRDVIDVVKRCREQSRFLLGLFSWVGYRQTGVEVPHAARRVGETKYSLVRMVSLALDTIIGFSWVPLRLATVLGFTVSLGSFAFGGWLIVRKLLYDTIASGWTSTMVTLVMLGGVQLLALGVLGEYIGRIYVESQDRPLYVVARRLPPLSGDAEEE
jgi:glycosyltransferase involved in cell wall biosynthesis